MKVGPNPEPSSTSRSGLRVPKPCCLRSLSPHTLLSEAFGARGFLREFREARAEASVAAGQAICENPSVASLRCLT